MITSYLSYASHLSYLVNPAQSTAPVAFALAIALLAAAPGARAADSPQWWRDTRAIYASFALSGAGGPLMKFPSDDIKKKLAPLGDPGHPSFDNLPGLLDEARRLGCNCIYLVDYWEPEYENKGDYIPRADLGGPAAFKRGIAKLHEKGGRIILYLEAFLITRTSEVGKSHGLDWAMMDAQGRPHTYARRDRFYLMYPGEGSGWTDYICGLAERLVRDYGVDGFHLDSYGCQWDWKDYNPKHVSAQDQAKFNQGAVNLVHTMRERIQKIRPDAIVMLECCEHTQLLDVCDGGQIESAAWQYSPINVLNEKPWVGDCKYKAFTSHYSIEENEKVLKMGYNLSLTPWWFQELPSEKDFEKMREHIDDPSGWLKRMRTLWYWDNLLYANGIPRPQGIDLFKLRRDLEMRQYAKPKPKHFDTEEYWAAVNAYEPLVRKLLSSGKPLKTQEQYMRQMLSACGKALQRH